MQSSSNKTKAFNKSKIFPKKVSAKSSIELEDEDICPPKEEQASKRTYKTPGLDPRFQQQDQTLRCYVMYVDYHHCQHLLGEENEACTWFKEVYSSICPSAWIERWDSNVEEGKMAWPKKNFPNVPYGKRCKPRDACEM